MIQRLLTLLLLLFLLNGCTLARSTVQTVELLRASQRVAPTVPTAPGATLPLLDLLRFVPNEPGYRQWLTFGDTAAWYAATGMSAVPDREGVRQLEKPERDWWLYDLPMQTLPPAALGIPYLLAEDMREVYGFSFFAASRFIEAGQPPHNLTIVETSADPNQIHQALLSAGYTATSIDDALFYSIRDDNEIDLQSPIRAGQLGQLNRIAVLGDKLLIGRATAVVTTAVDTANGVGATLAADPLYQALMTGLAAPPVAKLGQLVGLVLIGQLLANDLLPLLEGNAEVIEKQLTSYAKTPLPPYVALGFATQRAGTTTYLTLVVVFLPEVDGLAAATLLGERLSAYTSLHTERSLAERWSLAQSTAVEHEGLSVALVTMQLNATAATYTRPFTWSDLLAARDLHFLWVGEPVRP